MVSGEKGSANVERALNYMSHERMLSTRTRTHFALTNIYVIRNKQTNTSAHAQNLEGRRDIGRAHLEFVLAISEIHTTVIEECLGARHSMPEYVDVLAKLLHSDFRWIVPMIHLFFFSFRKRTPLLSHFLHGYSSKCSSQNYASARLIYLSGFQLSQTHYYTLYKRKMEYLNVQAQ